jgi:ATP-dependent Clp protease protease subunit
MRNRKDMAKEKIKLGRVITLGEITQENVNDIISLIYEINEEDIKKTQVEPIKLIINSFGGEVYSGLALIDVIDNSRTPIFTICYGTAMSMGLIVYVAGHERYASKNATFMYHEAAYPIEGKVKHHMQELKEVERIDKICDEYLLSKTKLTQETLDNIKITQSEWYFNVDDAVKYGIVDEKLESL